MTKLADAAEQEPAPPAAPGPNRKLLAHVHTLMFDQIPQDPGAARYRHGGTIPGGHREWFRGKTGNGRYRLFYRYDSNARIIVYAWINDRTLLAAATRGAAKAPRVFRRLPAP